jgi:hypothetical protein
MRNEDYLGYITDHLTTRELLEQLAEEAAELAQAALKTCRALDDSNNPTQVDEDEAWERLNEEMVDVLNAYCAVRCDFSAAAGALLDCHGSPKWERWYERVKGAQQE